MDEKENVCDSLRCLGSPPARDGQAFWRSLAGWDTGPAGDQATLSKSKTPPSISSLFQNGKCECLIFPWAWVTVQTGSEHGWIARRDASGGGDLI